MADLERVTPLGSIVSYSNASRAAGLVIEQVTGEPYEEVAASRCSRWA
jgi:CubicO group peptidase (beta-lactamase class C family)